MINHTTYLPHTYENQAVLREYGKKIAGSFTQQEAKSMGVWSRISQYFPTSQQAIGYKAGEHLALTYGAQWSNAAIDCVVRKFFQPEVKPPSSWSWEGVKNLFSGATQTTVAETLKLTITPKALPYMTVLTGAASSIALPTVISLVSLAYQKVMFDPRKLQQLSHLTLDQLFTVDAKTGRLRDAFGRLMSPEDMQDIFKGAAKYDLIRKLIELCHQVDQMKEGDDAIQGKIQHLLKDLIQSYTVNREDGHIMFPDGQLCTEEEQEIIHRGIVDLSRINPTHKDKNIRRFIRLLAQHSLLPLETLSFRDQEKETQDSRPPKRMPPIFPAGEQEWKNAIIRTSDEKYVIVQDIAGKKKGTLVSDKEMADIFHELETRQDQKSIEQKMKASEILEDFFMVSPPNG